MNIPTNIGVWVRIPARTPARNRGFSGIWVRSCNRVSPGGGFGIELVVVLSCLPLSAVQQVLGVGFRVSSSELSALPRLRLSLRVW